MDATTSPISSAASTLCRLLFNVLVSASPVQVSVTNDPCTR